MASASEPAALLVKNASLKDATNRVAMKLGYAKGMKKEQLEVVVAFLSGSDVFADSSYWIWEESAMHACLLFELLEETEEKPIVVVVTPLTAIIFYEGSGSHDVFYPH